MMERGMTKETMETLRRMLETKVCGLWPECGCYHTLVRWQENLRDEERVWEPEQLEWAETTIFFSLACVARHCPDPVTKAYAKGQLRKRFWDRQKSMCIWVEP
jgi:hypothetical protein